MSTPTYDKDAAARLRHILKLLDLSVPLSDADMMGGGLFTTLGMIRGSLEWTRPFAWVQRNAGFDSGAAHFGAKCPPGWPNAKACYAAPQRPVVDRMAAVTEMAYLLQLVPRGDIVPVQILEVVAKQFDAALEAAR